MHVTIGRLGLGQHFGLGHRLGLGGHLSLKERVHRRVGLASRRRRTRLLAHWLIFTLIRARGATKALGGA